MNVPGRQTLTTLLLILCSLLSGVAIAKAAEQIGPGKTVINSAAEQDYPPFCLLDREGYPTGFSVELLRSALAAMGREVTFRSGPWHEVRGWLETGEVEALPLVGRTPEREGLFDFTFPYMSLHGAIVVREGTTGIEDLDDLRGKQVAVMRGDNAEEFLRRNNRGFIIITTPSFDQALRELSAGLHDAVIIQRLVGLRLIQEYDLSNLNIINQPIDGFRQDFCFAVREGDRDTLALLNEGLALVMADGTYHHLHAKWFARYQLPDRAIIIGGDHNYPPYEFLDEKGQPAGYNVEVSRAIAEALGLDITIRLGPWTEIREALERGEIDALQGMFYSAARNLKVDFTPAHTVNHGVAVTRLGTREPPETLEQLKGLKIVVQTGDIMHEFAVEQGLAQQILVAGSQEDALRQVIDGTADVALVSRLTALYYKDTFDWQELAIGRTAFLSPDYCYAVMPANKALLAHLGEGLKMIEDNGEYQRIREKWMGVYERSTSVLMLKYIVMIAAPLLLIIGIVSLWSWSLRRQVAQRTRELLSSTEYQRALVACSPVALYSVDRAGKVLTWNNSAEHLFGWREDEVIGKLLPIVPEDKHDEFAAFLSSMDTGQILSGIEVIRRKKNGSLFNGSLSLAPIRDDSDVIVGVMGAMEDITERKRIEKEIEESEKRFRRAIEEAPFPIMMHAEDGQVLAISRSWLERTGYAADDISTIADWTQRAYGSEAEGMRRIIEQTYNFREAREEGHFTVTCSDGSQRFWDFSTTPLGRLPDDRRLAISMAADITELLHAQQNVTHLNHVLHAIRDINQLIVREQDPSQLIEKSCAVLTGSRGYRSALLVLFDTDRHLIAWAHTGNPECTNALDNMLQQGTTPPCCLAADSIDTVQCLGPDSPLCNECFLPPSAECRNKRLLCAHLHHEGVMLGHLVATQDPTIEIDREEQQLFTELAQDLAYALHTLRKQQEFETSERKRKSLEQQLVQAQKMESVGRLAGGVAHDYNNMLGVIIGNAELVLRKLPPTAPGHEEVEEILGAARRSADITRQLLAFARRQTISPRLVELNETIERSLKMLRRLIGEHIELIWHPGHEYRKIKIDPVQIDQLLTNLCVNARDAIADTGTITIETASCTFDDAYCTIHAGFVPGDFAMLAVSDNGAGMTREQVGSIFEPFYTTKALGEGTGLGLATVYGIVKQNDGFINVYSEPGEGTTFKIYIPLQIDTTTQDQAPSREQSSIQASGETILVVEDDPAILKMAGKLLCDLGYRPLLADSSQAALKQAQEAESLDLLLTDVIMPQMNGAELAGKIHSIRPDIGVVFMSGYTANIIAHKGVLNDNVSYVQKPFSRAELAAALKEALARR